MVSAYQSVGLRELAFVIDLARREFAKKFAEVTKDERPVRIPAPED